MIYHHTLVFMHEAITVGLLRAQSENGLSYPTNDRLFLARTSSNLLQLGILAPTVLNMLILSNILCLRGNMTLGPVVNLWIQ